MHPAYSIIFFTTVSGLGYGLAGVLGMNVMPAAAVSTKIAHLVALALISAGLMSSTLHLGNPQRAWRALSQWRSSWLSREGVLALVTFVPLCTSAFLSIFEDRYVGVIGITGTLLCLATVFCTSMIYASLRSIDAWHTPLTPTAYLLFSMAGGLVLACMFAALSGSLPVWLVFAALVALASAWSVKAGWRTRLVRMRSRSNPESATGLGAIGKVRLLERPHMTENYLTREMGYKIARKHANRLAALAILLGGLIPAALLVVALGVGDGVIAGPAIAALAVCSHVVGMLTERWLFFAEARHAVMSYYDT